jgi:phosphatidyl-myo-inositol dimannoside synthase
MIVLVLATDAFGGHGGIAKFNRDLLRALCVYPACSEVVAVPRHVPHPMEPLPAKLTYVTSGLKGKLHYTAAVLKVALRSPGFDLVVCGHIHLLSLAFLLRLWVRAPTVLVIHGVEAWEPKSRALNTYLVKKVSAFVSVSELTKQRFLEWTQADGKRGFLLPNAIELERFGPGPKNKALIDRYGLAGKTVLMTLGRMASRDRYKGFDEMLELLPILVKDILNVAYLIVGDGPDRRRLEEKAKSLGMDEHVVFAGLNPRGREGGSLRPGRRLRHAESGEGFGIVHLEAMACGIPAVVASKVDGSREAVRNGALGILVDPSDQEDVKTGVLEALNRLKGVVPEGLDYFSYGNFERRLHRIVENVAVSVEAGRGEYEGKA